jgi:hypothetical protein
LQKRALYGLQHRRMIAARLLDPELLIQFLQGHVAIEASHTFLEMQQVIQLAM